MESSNDPYLSTKNFLVRECIITFSDTKQQSIEEQYPLLSCPVIFTRRSIYINIFSPTAYKQIIYCSIDAEKSNKITYHFLDSFNSNFYQKPLVKGNNEIMLRNTFGKSCDFTLKIWIVSAENITVYSSSHLITF